MGEVSFDFMQHADLRASVISDFHEMQRSLETKCWKATLVLAGSIVEALLADQLHQKHPEENGIFTQDLGKSIDQCKDEELISQRNAALSTVVRHYRNLVHPGRSIRLQEIPDEEGAIAANALVASLAKSFATQHKNRYGISADRLLEKIKIDPSNIPIFVELVKELSSIERVRLYTTSAWALSEKIIDEDWQYGSYGLVSLGEILDRDLINVLSDEEKRSICTFYDQQIRKESESLLRVYEQSCFRWSLLKFKSNDKLARFISGHVIGKIQKDIANYSILLNDCENWATYEEFCDLIVAAIDRFQEWIDPQSRKDLIEFLTNVPRIEVFGEKLQIFCDAIASQSIGRFPGNLLILPPSPDEFDPFADE